MVRSLSDGIELKWRKVKLSAGRSLLATTKENQQNARVATSGMETMRSCS